MNVKLSQEWGVPNQFVIKTKEGVCKVEYFQSYKSLIVKRTYNPETHAQAIVLDERYWDCSQTTGKYRNLFLGEDRKETQKKIKSGEYKLVDLNEKGIYSC